MGNFGQSLLGVSSEGKKLEDYVLNYLKERITDELSQEDLLEDQNILDTLLAQASARSDIKTVCFFIDKGAGFNGVDDTGLTPIGAAIWNADLKLLNLLLEKGADHCHRIFAWRGVSPLELAYEQKEAKPEKSDVYDLIIKILKEDSHYHP